MSWFLKKRQKKNRRTATRRDQAHQPWDPQRTLNGLKLVGVITAIIALATGWRYSEKSLARYVAADHTWNADVTLVNVPFWMNQTTRDELCHLVGAAVGVDPLDHAGLHHTVRVLQSNPWIDRVYRIERLDQNKIRVSAKYRQPIALIESHNGYHLVSEHAIRLPGLYLKHQLNDLKLPLIVGVAAAAQRYGQIWPGNDLKAGLSLLTWLSDQPYLNQIRSIDVSGRDDRGRIHLVIRTDHGMVRWGLPPNIEQVVEPDAATKKRWLTDVYLQRGAIDAGGRIVDVYGAAVFVHQPVSYNDRRYLSTQYASQ